MIRTTNAVFVASILFLTGCGTASQGEVSDNKIAKSLEAISGYRSRGSNSQLAVPHSIVLGDFDNDGNTDFLQYWANKVFINHTDYSQTLVTSAAFPANVKRVITGNFYNAGFDHICVILANGSTSCYGISPDHTTLWWAMTQGTFIADNEDFVVGDFNGNGTADILVYPTAGGAFRMYTMGSNGFFGTMPTFSSGNLGSASAGLRLRAGDFNGDGRQDIAQISSSGQLGYFASVFDGTHDTFWWAFNTASGFVGSSDQVTIARINDDQYDDVVLRNTSTGATRFYQMSPSGNGLASITGVSMGQINTQGNSSIFWGSMHGTSLNEPGASNRDDALVYLNASNLFVRSDARWDGSTYTYWWDYSQYSPSNVLKATQNIGGPSVYAGVQMTLDAYGQFSVTPTIENHDQATGYMYNLVCNIGPYAVGYQGHVGPDSLFQINGPTRDTPGTMGVVDTGIAKDWVTLKGLWQAGPGKSSFNCQLATSSTLQQEINQIEQTIAGVVLQYFGLDSGSLGNYATCMASSSNKFTCGQDPRQCVTGGSADEGGDLDCDPQSPSP